MAKDKKVEQITDMEVDFAQWYTDVCKKAELIDYSSIKGMFIYRPYGYAIWENIQKELDLYELLRNQITKPMPLEQIITDFIRGAGVLSQKMVEEGYVRHTAKVRILALVHAGEFVMENEVIRPSDHSALK